AWKSMRVRHLSQVRQKEPSTRPWRFDGFWLSPLTFPASSIFTRTLSARPVASAEGPPAARSGMPRVPRARAGSVREALRATLQGEMLEVGQRLGHGEPQVMRVRRDPLAERMHAQLIGMHRPLQHFGHLVEPALMMRD